MIAIEHNDNLIAINVFGEFTLADFKEFENLVIYKARFEGPVDVLVNLREMLTFTLDVAWEELRFSREHAKDFRNIAVVTENQWVSWSAWFSQFFTQATVQTFEDEQDALQWLSFVAEETP